MDEQKPMPEVWVADPSAESEPKQDEGQCQVRREAGGSDRARQVRKTSHRAATGDWLHTEGQ